VPTITRFNRQFSWPAVLLIACLATQLLVLPGSADAGQRGKQKAKGHRPHKAAPAAAVVDEQMLKTQVMLDRAGYSPGEIDAAKGSSTDRALAAFTKNGGNASALPADAVTSYAITEQDAAGPFTPAIPSDMMALAKLPALGYTSLVEALGERFHTSPELLKRLNPAAKFTAGETISVPNVAATVAPVGPPPGRQNDPSNPALTTVTVHKSSSDLVVTDNAGKILMYAPVTTGSEHDPLPIGEWKVTGVQRDPKFHYNPALFWDAEPAHSKATIPAGPNNPVGVVWVDITRPHYGMHGTPEPSKIGKTESHGCVRLTNWDAQKLASLVRPGTRVVFAN
jgi:lipoprotein-anchoring transpeptidase ErfK/SrfK